MHFPYTYIPHEVEKFQRYSDFLFLEVWFKAKGEFNSSKLNGFSELKYIYEKLHNEDSEGATFFNSHIKLIYDEFSLLKKDDKVKLRKWYKINNNIGSLCTENRTFPITYKKLISSYPKLGILLQTFYKRLYGSKSPFNLVTFNELGELMNSHYKSFMKINNEEICPFCGIHTMKGIHHSKREAYDHFIPKGKYPFNSINFKNLAPMCHECNSSYKLVKEPLMFIDPVTKKRTAGELKRRRRKAFNPFSTKKWEVNFSVNLKSIDLENLEDNKIDCNFTSINDYSHKEQIEGWREVYGIDERYKARILSKRGAKKWYNGLNDELRNFRILSAVPDIAMEKLYDMKIKEMEADPFDNCNFVKKAFLQECYNKGLF